MSDEKEKEKSEEQVETDKPKEETNTGEAKNTENEPGKSESTDNDEKPNLGKQEDNEGVVKKGDSSTSDTEKPEDLSANDKKDSKQEVADHEVNESDNEDEHDMKTLYNPDTYQNPVAGPRRLRINFRPVSDESEKSDVNEHTNDDDDNEIKKTIMVGSDYQAQIPEEFSKYDDALPYENKDKLVWDGCDKLPEPEILDYLRKVRIINHPAATDSITQQLLAIPVGNHMRDDEQALFLLQQCGHDIEEALRRRKIAVAPPDETMSAWSEEECRNFETGLRLYGKNFHQIQLSKVKTRSVGEIVQFYYLWKKSERHDVFASKARLDKKKYSLNPGQCIMDRFLEDQDGNLGVSNTNESNNAEAIPRNVAVPMCV